MCTSADSELTALAKREMGALGLLEEASVIDSDVVRQAKDYPVYDASYQHHVETIRREAPGALSRALRGGPQRHAQVQQPRTTR